MTRRRALLLSIILLAFWLRVWRLPQTPPGLWYDEAYYSMDAAWLLDGGPWQLFFAGNNGREPIFIYLQTVVIWIFGAHPLTSRLLAPLIGTLTVAALYVLARRLGRRAGWSIWLPHVAATGLATSFWHVGLSRGGYRGVLLPLAAALVFYTFWRGWRDRSPKFMLLAGLTLGLSQYTYLAARVFPLALGLYALVWTAFNWQDRLRRNALWLTMLVMALISALVFAPLGWIFYQDPALFSARTGDVLFTPDTPAELFGQLSQAVRLFIDAGDPNWRHHLPGRPMLGWLGWLGFWPGLIICLRRWRRPPHLLLVVALLTFYLPALLSVPPVHALRLSDLLPIYYLIFSFGLIELTRLKYHVSRFTFHLSRSPLPAPRLLALLIIAVLLFETGLTIFDYFGRWAKAEETYVEYNGPLVDFVNEAIERSAVAPVVIPFHLYVHPTTRYLLHDWFVEQPAPADLSGPVQLVTLPSIFRMLNVANIPELPSLVWLEQGRGHGSGVIYVSRPPRQAERAYLNDSVADLEPEVFTDRFDRPLAEWRTLADPIPLLPMFTDPTPERLINLTWDRQAQLLGYDVTPAVARPGQPVTVNFYWRSLTNQTFDERLFLQLIDAAGQPINQYEGEAFREDMYRWRPDGLLPSQHTLWLGPDTPPGPYLVRLGFFDERTGQRLPILKAEGGEARMEDEAIQPAVDQIQLGLFYVSTDDTDPRQPALPLDATFGETIQLIGVTLPQIHNSQFTTPALRSGASVLNSPLIVTFHWRAFHPTDRPYTIFLQLLDAQGQVVSSWDSQPFHGLYPTDLWSPGEVIADTFLLPLPAGGLPSGRYRLITGFYNFDTGQRLPLAAGGDFALLAEFEVE